jgi:pimeloyl-ACP methyl ester carboxylesterase
MSIMFSASDWSSAGDNHGKFSRPARAARAAYAAALAPTKVAPRSLWSVCLSVSILALGFLAQPQSVTASLKPRGEMVDIGGRRLRIVCDGPVSAKPVVVFESGAFGFSGDWSYVQNQLKGQGVRSCAYDRAGMGLSDVSTQPRDGVNVAQDLEKLLIKAKVPAPYVLVGHSMAGARVHLFANRNPDKVAGLVLVDSTTPDAAQDPQVAKYIADFTAESHAAAMTAQFGILKLLRDTPLGDKVGLPGPADEEKRAQFASASYNRTAYDEVKNWPLAAAQGRATGPLNANWPVAVVSAGVLPADEGAQIQALQPPPARASQHGFVTVVPGASHNGLLGARYSPSIVQGIDFVLNAAQNRTAPAGQTLAQAAVPGRMVAAVR